MAALERVQALLRDDPAATKVSLAKTGVSDLTPLLPFLGRFGNLRELDLSNNMIRALPSDLSALRDVESLFLAGNPVRDHSALLTGLKSMPNLKHLMADMGSEAQEDRLVFELSKLRSFNGVIIDDTEEEEGGVSGAAQLPPPAQPSQSTAHTHDSADHGRTAAAPATAAAAAVDPAASQGDDDPDPPLREVSMTEDDLENVALLFGAVKTLRASTPGVDEAGLTVAFDAHIEAVMQYLRERLEGETNPFVRQAEILRAKYDLHDVVAAHAAEHAAVAGSGSREFGAVLRKLRGTQRAALEELPQVVQDAVKLAAARERRLVRRLDSAQHEVARLAEAVGHLERDLRTRGISRSDAERDFERERTRLLDENRRLRETAAELRVLLRQHAATATNTNTTTTTTATPAAAVPGAGAAGAPRGAGPTGQGSFSAHGGVLPASGSSAMVVVAAAPAGAGNIPTTGYAARHAAASRVVAGVDGTSAPFGASAPGHAMGESVAPGPGGSSSSSEAPAGTVTTATTSQGVAVKSLSLKQLREVIDAIYASKLRFDEKCADAHLPRETLEQHLYTFLNQRYGLKRLIVEHASAVIRAVNRFSAVDNDVCVFGQILRNEVEERFVDTQRSLKNTVKDLIRVFLKGKYPLKTDAAIDELLQSRVATVVFEEEWRDTVNFMYREQDAEALCAIIREVIATDPGASSNLRAFKETRVAGVVGAAAGASSSGLDGSGGFSGSSSNGADGAQQRRRRRTGDASREEQRLHSEAVARGAINYAALLKTMLDFQLRGHQKYLEKFRRAFAGVDADNNGVVNEAEFRRLVRQLDPSKSDEQIEALLQQIDPWGHAHITFSDCVESLLGSG